MIFDATDENFGREVVERSKERPVVVDFWAPWCAPCRALAPLLEGLAEEAAGEFDLVRVNIDESPQCAQDYAVKSIPAVKAFRDGEVAAEFVGAQPETVLRQFLAGVLPSPADRGAEAARTHAAAGRWVEAEAGFRDALELDSRHAGALLGLARCRAVAGDSEQALALLERVLPGVPEALEAERLAAELRLEAGLGKEGEDLEALRARVAADPDDCAARLLLGRALAADEQPEAALEVLLEAVKRDPDYQEEAARKAMLDLFALLGNDHELTQRFRAALARILFR